MTPQDMKEAPHAGRALETKLNEMIQIEDVSRPKDCPIRDCGTGCELVTFSASQYGAIFTLIGACFLTVYKILNGIGEETDKPLAFQYYMLLACSAAFYFFVEWKIESGMDFYRLRSITWGPQTSKLLWLFRWWVPLRYLEFGIRLLVSFLFGLAITAPSELHFANTLDVNSLDIGMLAMSTIYTLLVFWDWVVSEGGQTEIVWRVFIFDATGASLTFATLFCHLLKYKVASFVFVFILFGVVFSSLSNLVRVTNLIKRDRLR